MITLDSHGKVIYKCDSKSHDELIMALVMIVPVLVAVGLFLLLSC